MSWVVGGAKQGRFIQEKHINSRPKSFCRVRLGPTDLSEPLHPTEKFLLRVHFRPGFARGKVNGQYCLIQKLGIQKSIIN